VGGLKFSRARGLDVDDRVAHTEFAGLPAPEGVVPMWVSKPAWCEPPSRWPGQFRGDLRCEDDPAAAPLRIARKHGRFR
jgi:hypothetical protein